MDTTNIDEGNLLVYFSRIKDPRRQQGQRHSLELMLLLTLMSIMSGYIGYRAIGDFVKRNKDELLSLLDPPKKRLPSFDAIRDLLIRIDFNEVSQQFRDWAMQYTDIDYAEWMSVDGKAIGGTTINAGKTGQDFVSLVSVYCAKQKVTIGNAEVINSKDHEIPVVKQLIKTLGLEGVTFTLDALHCQKKQQRQLLKATMTM